MKTIAWTPSPDLNSAEFSIDDEVIFSALASKTTKRVTLLGALLAAGAYAGMNLGFEIRNKSQDVLAVFEPGNSVKGYPTIIQALVEVATHLDNHAKNAVTRTVENLKPEAVRLYEQGIVDGVLAERARWVPAPAAEDGISASDGRPSEEASATDNENIPASPAQEV